MSKSKMRKVKELPKSERVVIAKYIRVSTDKQREEGYSVDIQKERLDQYVKSLYPESEYQVEYREYVDDGFSGGSLERPQMMQLIDDVIKKKITHVVVLKLDRLSRSQKDTLYLIEDVFLPNNVAFISMGESFNTSTAFGRAVVGILSVFAQLERENIYERTRSGMQKRVELGYWPGGGNVPFGYDYDQEQGILVPNKDAEVVRRIYDLYLNGYSKQIIADMCGLKYGVWVDRILSRKTNAGIISYNGQEYKGLHEPLISMETYQKTMDLMAERSEKRTVVCSDHLLTGVVYCGKCGAKMRYMKWGKAGYKLMCYSQFNSKPYLVRDPDCDNRRPWSDDLEKVVEDAIFRRAKQHVEKADAEFEKESPLKMMEEQRLTLAKKLKRLYGLYAAGDDVLLDAIEELKRELESQEKLILAEKQRSAVTKNALDAQHRLETLGDYWEHMSVSEKRNIILSVVDRIIVSDNHVHVEFKY